MYVYNFFIEMKKQKEGKMSIVVKDIIRKEKKVQNEAKK